MSKAPQTLTEEASSSGVGASQEFQQIGPSKQSNQIIALASVLVAVGLFASGRLETLVGPGLNQLTANAIPYEEVLHILLSPSSVIDYRAYFGDVLFYVVPTWIGDLRTQKICGD
jgi:hypothetical protein